MLKIFFYLFLIFCEKMGFPQNLIIFYFPSLHPSLFLVTSILATISRILVFYICIFQSKGNPKDFQLKLGRDGGSLVTKHYNFSGGGQSIVLQTNNTNIHKIEQIKYTITRIIITPMSDDLSSLKQKSYFGQNC